MPLHIFESRAVGPLACNCYIAGDPDSREAIVIDPGGDADDLIAVLTRERLTVKAIVATHAHFDHLIAAERLREVTGAPLHLHADDIGLLGWFGVSAQMFLGVDVGPAPEVDSQPREGDVLRAGSASLTVMHTPGHSQGSISLVTDGVVFSGDTLFAGGVGRVDLPGGDGRRLVDAIKTKLFELEDETVVLPGHGPATTIARERAMNPFVGERAGLWVPEG